MWSSKPINVFCGYSVHLPLSCVNKKLELFLLRVHTLMNSYIYIVDRGTYTKTESTETGIFFFFFFIFHCCFSCLAEFFFFLPYICVCVAMKEKGSTINKILYSQNQWRLQEFFLGCFQVGLLYYNFFSSDSSLQFFLFQILVQNFFFSFFFLLESNVMNTVLDPISVC